MIKSKLFNIENYFEQFKYIGHLIFDILQSIFVELSKYVINEINHKILILIELSSCSGPAEYMSGTEDFLE